MEGVNPVELYPFGDDADVFWDEYIRGLDPAGFVFNDEVDEGLNASEPVLANNEDTGTSKSPPLKIRGYLSFNTAVSSH